MTAPIIDPLQPASTLAEAVAMTYMHKILTLEKNVISITDRFCPDDHPLNEPIQFLL